MECRNEQNDSRLLSYFIVFNIGRLQCREIISVLGYWTLHCIPALCNSKLSSASSVIYSRPIESLSLFFIGKCFVVSCD
jgi:hypothetical protein